ncbi:hypothetical protein B0I33_110197 [Prauserella shujinwangii]|uniref:Ketohydroxyglutarate aldolase n=1 Tax=Prauserella shujinwangii TaxID=1453103 RepID=A0A2T0LPE5_9PSEU|nr:hypothetical protein [Prauserella shujinwangii]PRX45098.1 hypothetical protein B0I33_110197 [Prauserella shujinwangii]
MDRAADRKVVVLISEPALHDVEDVVSRLKQAGMAVDAVQAVLGTVTGSAPADVVAGLRAVPGVLDVELQRDLGTR